jgi:hypothetical protein
MVGTALAPDARDGDGGGARLRGRGQLHVAAAPRAVRGLGSAGPGFTNRDLARALGDSGDLFVSPWITCRTRSGRVDNRPFNRRCLRRDMEGPCYPGTGETRTAIFVRIRARRYHVVDERVLWVAPACASVA